MIWTPAPKPPHPRIPLGTIRFKRKFAFIPLRLYNDDYIWLEFYRAEQVYGERWGNRVYYEWDTVERTPISNRKEK